MSWGEAAHSPSTLLPPSLSMLACSAPFLGRDQEALCTSFLWFCLAQEEAAVFFSWEWLWRQHM